MAGKVIAKSTGLRRCKTVEPLTHNMIMEDDEPPFESQAAERPRQFDTIKELLTANTLGTS